MTSDRVEIFTFAVLALTAVIAGLFLRKRAPWQIVAWGPPVVAVAVFIAFAWRFYADRWPDLVASKPDTLMCVFGSPECSVAVGTWLLVGVSMLAFGAAMTAANWASLALNNEMRTRLGEDDCVHDHCGDVDRHCYILSDGRFSDVLPIGATETQFEAHHRRYVNLGRSALGQVAIAVLTQDGGSDRRTPVMLPIGNIGVSDDHRERHIEIRTLRRLRVRVWAVAAFCQGKPVDEFMPLDHAAPPPKVRKEVKLPF